MMDQPSQNRMALVLGELATAVIVANSLRKLGFNPVFPGEVPQIAALDCPLGRRASLDQIRALVAGFKEFSGGRGIIHPGVTPLAEKAELQAIGQELGVPVVAPSTRLLSLFDNKLNLLFEAERMGIPNLVLSFDPVHSVREIQRFVRRNKEGFPFVMKSAKGGGQFATHVVQNPQTLVSESPIWFEQLRWNMGEVILFPEKYLEGARLISVPFVRLGNGKIVVFPMSDASLHSRYRKIVEFCPPPSLDRELEQKLRCWTEVLADGFGYVGVGTFEYVVDGVRPYLSGGQARLNTAFHLWEELAGTSAVGWQLKALESSESRESSQSPESQGPIDSSIPGIPSGKRGVSIRFCAEDSIYHLPQSGELVEISPSTRWSRDGVLAELSMNYRPGEQLQNTGTGVLGLLQVITQNPKKLLSETQNFLDRVWITGSLYTNERFLKELLSHPWIVEGIFHTGFIDEEFLPQVTPPTEYLDLVPAICTLAGGITEDSRWVIADRWIRGTRASSAPMEGPHLQWEEGPRLLNQGPLLSLCGVLLFNDTEELRVCATQLADRWLVRLGDWLISARKTNSEVSADKSKGRRRLVALVSGRVHAILFREKSNVEPHETVVILESFGVLVPHALPVSVQILEWKIVAEQKVSLGQELAILELRRSV